MKMTRTLIESLMFAVSLLLDLSSQMITPESVPKQLEFAYHYIDNADKQGEEVTALCNTIKLIMRVQINIPDKPILKLVQEFGEASKSDQDTSKLLSTGCGIHESDGEKLELGIPIFKRLAASVEDLQDKKKLHNKGNDAVL